MAINTCLMLPVMRLAVQTGTSSRVLGSVDDRHAWICDKDLKAT